jgi:hypothetical protein
MEIAELDLKAKVDNAIKEQEATQHEASTASEATGNALLDAESLINLKSMDLEEKKGELVWHFIVSFVDLKQDIQLLMTIFTYTETIGRQGAKIGQSMVFG